MFAQIRINREMLEIIETDIYLCFYDIYEQPLILSQKKNIYV